jgi:hypothetical protein
MNVGELIDKLSRYPREMLIAIRDDCPRDTGEFERINIEHRVGDDEIILVIE